MLQAKHVYYFIDAILLVTISISLAELHLVLSCVAIIIASIFNGMKFFDYLKEKRNLKKLYKNNEKNISDN